MIINYIIIIIIKKKKISFFHGRILRNGMVHLLCRLFSIYIFKARHFPLLLRISDECANFRVSNVCIKHRITRGYYVEDYCNMK